MAQNRVKIPFRDIAIFPSYGLKQAAVVWAVDPYLRDAEFYIYKQQDGGQEWELITETPIYGTRYIDTDFYSSNKTDIPAYRILAIKNNEEYDSDIIALYSKVERREFGVAQAIIRDKYRQFRQDGTLVLYYPVKVTGPISDNIEEETGQRQKATCPNDASPDSDFGTYYKGGYAQPFLTFISFNGAKLQRKTILDEGVYDDATQLVDFLPFPPVRSGDLIVDVEQDKRWIVNSSIKTHFIKNTPIGYEANMTLQPHSHPCYHVPVPDNYGEMRKQTLYPFKA